MKTIFEKTYIAQSLAEKAAVKEFGDDWAESYAIEKASEGRKYFIVALAQEEDDDLETELDSVESLADGADVDAEEDEDDPRNMSKLLRQYRAGYIKTLSSSGNISADNGDDVAELLRGLDHNTVCHIADLVKEVEIGYHSAKYSTMGVGQRRMCAGNIIRAKIKGGEMTADDLADLIKITS